MVFYEIFNRHIKQLRLEFCILSYSLKGVTKINYIYVEKKVFKVAFTFTLHYYAKSVT